MKQAIHLLRESVKSKVLKDLLVGVSASLILALCAPISFQLGFTPVPITIQVQVALFLSAFLGARRACFMILAFIGQGVVGFPVFAGGASTILTLIGPRGGYLLGYLVAAFIVGKIYQSIVNKNAMKLFFAMALGNLVVYLLGFVWLSNFVGCQKAFAIGILPFVFLDLLKLAMFSFLKTPVTLFLNSLCKKA